MRYKAYLAYEKEALGYRNTLQRGVELGDFFDIWFNARQALGRMLDAHSTFSSGYAERSLIPLSESLEWKIQYINSYVVKHNTKFFLSVEHYATNPPDVSEHERQELAESLLMNVDLVLGTLRSEVFSEVEMVKSAAAKEAEEAGKWLPVFTLSDDLIPFGEYFNQIPFNTYNGKSYCYAQSYLTLGKLRKCLPPQYVANLIFPTNLKQREGLRLDKAGVLQRCELKATNTMAWACSSYSPFDIELEFGLEASNRVRLVVRSLDEYTIRLEQKITSIAESLGEGGTYKQILQHLVDEVIADCSRYYEVKYSDLIPHVDCRNTILYWDGERALWFDEEWVCHKGTLKEAAASGVKYVNEMLHRTNEVVRLYKRNGIGNKIDTLHSRFTSEFQDVRTYSTNSNLGMLNLQVLSELEEGDTVEDFYKKVPKKGYMPTCRRAYDVYPALLKPYDEKYDGGMLTLTSVEREYSEKHSSVVSVSLFYDLHWFYRYRLLKLVEDEPDRILDEALKALEMLWSSSSNEVLPVEFYSSLKLSYVDNMAKLKIDLSIPISTLDKLVALLGEYSDTEPKLVEDDKSAVSKMSLN